MSDLSNEELRARLKWAMGEAHLEPFVEPLRELQRLRAAQTASADRVRAVVLRIAGDVLEHPDTDVLRAFDVATEIADRIAAQLTPAPLSTADVAILKRLRDNEARAGNSIGHLGDDVRRGCDAAVELLDRLLGGAK